MDHSIFQRLMDSWYDPLYRFALSLSRNADDALDLTQQTFARWAEKGATLRDEGKAKSWLFTVLYREFLDTRRLQRREVLGEAEAALDREPDRTNSAEKKIDSGAAMAALWQLEEIFLSHSVLRIQFLRIGETTEFLPDFPAQCDRQSRRRRRHRAVRGRSSRGASGFPKACVLPSRRVFQRSFHP